MSRCPAVALACVIGFAAVSVGLAKSRRKSEKATAEQPPPPPQPPTTSPSALAAAAEGHFRQRVAQAQSAYTNAVEAARTEYLGKLDDVMTAETRRGNLDRAVAIREEIQRQKE